MEAKLHRHLDFTFRDDKNTSMGAGVGNGGILCYTLRQVIGQSLAGGAHVGIALTAADQIPGWKEGFPGAESEFRGL